MRRINLKYVFLDNSGLSLLELMVAVSLTVLLAGGGFFSFVNYSRSQAHSQTVQNIKFAYVQARNNAISNVKPTENCVTLRNYRIILQSNSYRVEVVCLDAAGVAAGSGTDIPLPNGIVMEGVSGTLENCSGIGYRVITGNVTPDGPSTTLPCSFVIQHQDDENLTETITIQSDGMISS